MNETEIIKCCHHHEKTNFTFSRSYTAKGKATQTDAVKFNTSKKLNKILLREGKRP